jgi:hypothetical protein
LDTRHPRSVEIASLHIGLKPQGQLVSVICCASISCSFLRGFNRERGVVRISIEDGLVNFDVEGIDKVWSFKSRLTIPLTHIRSVKIDTEAARGWWHGLRLLGTQLPGVLTAGTFYENGGIVFYDVHDPDKTIVLELDHERYQRLIVEVESPQSTLRALEKAYTPRK